jgi:hypothetical protein
VATGRRLRAASMRGLWHVGFLSQGHALVVRYAAGWDDDGSPALKGVVARGTEKIRPLLVAWLRPSGSFFHFFGNGR